MRVTSLTVPQMALLASCTDIGWEGAEPEQCSVNPIGEEDIDRVGIASVMNHGSVEDNTGTGSDVHIIHANDLERNLLSRAMSAFISDNEGTPMLEPSEAMKLKEMLRHLPETE